MQEQRKHKRLGPLLYGGALVLFTVYVLLDAFVIPRRVAAEGDASSALIVQSEASELPADSASKAAAVPSASAETAPAQSASFDAAAPAASAETPAPMATPVTETIVTDTSYLAPGVSIVLTQYREYDTDIYVADVVLLDADALSTAFAYGSYGKNLTEKTSEISADCGAILAVNGDYYGTRSGYVIRNGVLYRSASAGRDQQDLVIWADGSFSVVREGDVGAQELIDAGARQLLSFGPGLLLDGEIAVSETTEVDKARTSNPRTAIGLIEPLHYVFVVADGRSSASAGLTLYELASFLRSLGVQCAYNLDGGGSSTMVFNGVVVNNPTSNGKKFKEREVSDIVFIG